MTPIERQSVGCYSDSDSNGTIYCVQHPDRPAIRRTMESPIRNSSAYNQSFDWWVCPETGIRLNAAF